MIEQCPLCGSAEWREIFRALRPAAASSTGRHTEDLFGRAGRIVRCSSCRLVRQFDPPTAPYEDAEDPEYLTEERGIAATFTNVLERIERYRAPPGRLLDVGCGPGVLIGIAKQRGWTVKGIEPSRWGVDQARQRGLDVTQGMLENTDLDPGSFDVVVAADVIEHVTDPVAFATRIHSLLLPGGVVFIATPNVESVAAKLLRRWWWSVIPNHLLFFSPRTLGDVLRKGGLNPVDVSTHPKTFSIEYYAARFGGYGNAIGKLTTRIGGALGGRERLVTPDFKDRTAMLARKEQ